MTDMSEGSIAKHIIVFALPLMLGNVFQLLYNTVDSIVVGNFVGKQALAAIGSTGMIVNMLVFFFNGFSSGASVVIGQYFGARHYKDLHEAVETTIAATFLLCVAFTAAALPAVKPLLRIMATPDDVFAEATIYLKIYISGISGLLIYNVCSGILRAVGDSRRPLYFLILTSIINIILDLFFVLVLNAGIAGVAYATIISQFISAFLTLALLSRSKEVYHLTWHDLKIVPRHLKRILAIGLPAGIQSVLTTLSNIFVQGYINFFGSSCMAGWSTYNKLDGFIMLPMQSTAIAATTFVSQNIGAGKKARARKGAITSVLLTVGITIVVEIILFVFAAPAVKIFSPDMEVIAFGTLFIRTNILFTFFNCIVHVLAGGLRGSGDSRGPMVIMLSSFVVLRQTYLFVLTRYIANTAQLVGFGYPVGWMACACIEVCYFLLRWPKTEDGVSEG